MMLRKTFFIAVCMTLMLFQSHLLYAQDWQLVWSDEFDGTTLDANKWTLQIGDGCPDLCGWGNNELQWYTASNHSVADGVLTITAKAEQSNGKSYTSTRMRTINKGDWTYGRFEARAKLPIGQGIWPAIWMLPTESPYGIWAASGEIDIMEIVGHEPSTLHGTIHFGGEWPTNQSAANTYDLPSGTFNDDFHVFAIEWEETEIRWYIDDQLYSTQSNWSSENGTFPAPFDVDFHLLVNLAVGGNWPGSPDASTQFPQELVVDYVRVYEDISTGGGETGGILIFDDMEHGDPDANSWFTFDGAGGGVSADENDVPQDGGSYSLAAAYPFADGYIGGFGRTNRLNLADVDHFNFWINPAAGQSYTLELQFQDDDNGDNVIPTPSSDDDEFQFDCVISDTGPCAIAGGGWQLVSIPFTDLRDDNSFHNGGNSVFDPVPESEGGNGQLINLVVTVVGNRTGINFNTDNWTFTDGVQPTSVDELSPLPNQRQISSAYPNPFSTTSQFDLTVDTPQLVKIEVFDLLGRTKGVLFDGMLAANEKTSFRLDGRDWANGVYLYQVTGESFTETRRVVLMR